MQENGISLKDVSAVNRALLMMSEVIGKRAWLDFLYFSHGPQCSWAPIIFLVLDDVLQRHEHSQPLSFMEVYTCKI